MSQTSRTRRTLWLRFIVGMSLYLVLVVVQSTFLEPGTLPLWAMIPVALIPMVPAVWVILIAVEVIRKKDELQRRIHVEASVYALGATALLTFSYGFLEAYAEFPELSMFFVWPVITLSYWGGQVVTRRAYR